MRFCEIHETKEQTYEAKLPALVVALNKKSKMTDKEINAKTEECNAFWASIFAQECENARKETTGAAS